MNPNTTAQMVSLWPSQVLIEQLDELEDVREDLAMEAERFFERHTQLAAKMAHRADTVSMMWEQPSQALLRLLACIEKRVQTYLQLGYPAVDASQLATTYNTFVNRRNVHANAIVGNAWSRIRVITEIGRVLKVRADRGCRVTLQATE